MDYLYLSDESRKVFASTVDRALLPSIAALSYFWNIEQLNVACDEELCNSLADLNIGKSEIEDWNPRIYPKFNMLLLFIQRVAGEGSIDDVIEQMKTPGGAAQIAASCTPEEIAIFATFKTVFGKECHIPEGAFGKREWEKAFPVKIKPEWIPPLPSNIHSILEKEDPWEPGKKLKETCRFFLRPEKVILHEEGCYNIWGLYCPDVIRDTEIPLNISGASILAAKAGIDTWACDGYKSFDRLYDQIPVMKSGWVLIRKEVIPGSRVESRKYYRLPNQERLLKGGFEAPKLVDVTLLHIITYALEREFQDPRLTDTRCEERIIQQDIEFEVRVHTRVRADNSIRRIVYNSYNEPMGLLGSLKFSQGGFWKGALASMFR